jgi:hypothetical protein
VSNPILMTWANGPKATLVMLSNEVLPGVMVWGGCNCTKAATINQKAKTCKETNQNQTQGSHETIAGLGKCQWHTKATSTKHGNQNFESSQGHASLPNLLIIIVVDFYGLIVMARHDNFVMFFTTRSSSSSRVASFSAAAGVSMTTVMAAISLLV